MDMRPTARLAALAALLALGTMPQLPAMAAIQAPSPLAFAAELSAPADSILFLPSGEAIVALSRTGRTVSIISTAGREVLRSVSLPFGPVDADISADGAHIYAVGPGEAAGSSLLARVDAADGALRMLALNDADEITGISLSPRGDLYLVDRDASGVTRIAGDLFEKASPNEPLAVSLKEVGRSGLYFKSGIVDVAATDKPGLVFILHEFENVASVVDLSGEKVVDQLSLATQAFGLAPLVQTLSARRGASKSPEVVTSAVFGDSGGNRIVVSDLDLGFSSLEIVQTIDLATQFPERSNNIGRQLLVAADEQQDVILVGATTSRSVMMFKRVDRTVERVGVAELPEAPVDLEVSPDGRALAFLVDGGTELIAIDQPDVWRELFAETPSDSASVIRDIQRMLSALGYPVGVVDGMLGFRTVGAIKLFQESQGLPATGAASLQIQEALRAVVPQGNNFEFKKQDAQVPMRRK